MSLGTRHLQKILFRLFVEIDDSIEGFVCHKICGVLIYMVKVR